MRQVLMGVVCFVSVIGGIVLIKLLDLPGIVTIMLVAGLILGMIILMAKCMPDDQQNDAAVKGNPSAG